MTDPDRLLTTSTTRPAGPASTRFPTDVRGLDRAQASSPIDLADGDDVSITIAPVAARIGTDTIRMLAYNGSVPGPTLRVRQGSEVTVHVRNQGDGDTTVHWHGLRLDSAYDGVPDQTQAPIPVGGEFAYRLRFPDPGLYWYHPHVREDHGLEMGLYANIVVEPSDPAYWPRADRDLLVTLDDVLIEAGRMAPFSTTAPDHVAMGRFGNVLLTAGRTEWRETARAGEIVRLHLTNTANTRLFNVGIAGAPMKLVGGDSGRYEQEAVVDAVLLAPSERAVVDVLFDSPGSYQLEHRTPDRTYILGAVEVTDERPAAVPPSDFAVLRTAPELLAERARMQAALDRVPDKVLSFTSEMPLLYGSAPATSTGWTCPMHADVVRDEPGTCPLCGMRLVPVSAEVGRAPAAAHAHEDAHGGSAAGGDGLEWEDLMPEINAASTPENMFWRLVDGQTGAVNADIDWTFFVGDQVKIRLVNDAEQDHPMHHPFHVHGAGRLLVLTRNGTTEPNLVWKDTVLVRAAETVDILLDVSNPGLWMAHCHIAEHSQGGMMFSFVVLPAEVDSSRP
ncbi:Multicopper oxidase [Geodermatophilus africanus]|uniref:Multicopper oxidase n=1 Tax=Geodermatophilus africanus TaxID=1137993 RepID=A0A1H3RH50_9ACTN|nr:multicopper oxidase family protein [Geodermatophilus africanus]SDZ24986.1 Multicopper oxidase [Geodermatophilus africanus]